MDGALAEYACSYCGELNETLVDPTAGITQSYIEDCSICCHPNVLSVRLDALTGEVKIEARREE